MLWRLRFCRLSLLSPTLAVSALRSGHKNKRDLRNPVETKLFSFLDDAHDYNEDAIGDQV